jgi:uncharacterized Zn ribbon protein
MKMATSTFVRNARMNGGKDTTVEEGGDTQPVVRDSVGNILNDGDTVTVIKDLKVKGLNQLL